MIQFLIHLFMVAIYQPFFNVLVFFYWAMDAATGKPDMGVAVILLTIIIRLLLLPLSLSSTRTEPERRKIADEVRALEEAFAHDPIRLEREKKKVLKINRRILISELANLFIQVVIAIMLWKIFAHGLAGEDIHLIYSFMPDVHLPFNLMFMGTYDLTHPHLVLNLIQSGLIFVFETLSMLSSPYKSSRGEVARMQLVLPLVSFVIFMGLPAGKKLFVITTLIFSIILLIIRVTWQKLNDYKDQVEAKEAAAAEGQPKVESVVVDVK